jgi:REP element-mobilizing transposase RayT
MAHHRLVTTKGIYFITFTCYNWISLIDKTNSYNLVYKWFDILTEKGNSITGFCIMPNHLHMLLYYNGSSKSVSTLVGNGKRFMAYEIVKRLKDNKETWYVNLLNNSVTAFNKNRGKLHEVWMDGFDIKECRTQNFLLQKLNYIHKNPCAGKWTLAAKPVEYIHSSASYYHSGKTNYPLIRHYREFLSR